jgi:hypothetical protein
VILLVISQPVGGGGTREGAAMVKGSVVQGQTTEDLLAEVATAAYRVTLRHSCKGAFIDVELDLWHALQARLRRVSGACPAENPAANR